MLEKNLVPRVVDRYSLGPAIAADALGTLHVGRFEGPVGFWRPVLIKRLHQQFATDLDFVKVFVAGARLAARIRHPNVIATLDVVATKTELLLVTDNVPGTSLATLLRRAIEGHAPIPTRIACAFVADILSGVAAGHAVPVRGADPGVIVHGNLSPDSVLAGEDGLARVDGFGFSKTSEWLQTTREGRFRGKLAYAAPELLRGEGPTPLSDIFAASVMFWEALTGRPLFVGATAMELFEAVLGTAIRSPRDIVGTVPEDVAKIAMRGLSRDPSNRFATARAMALALERSGAVASAIEVSDWLAGQQPD